MLTIFLVLLSPIVASQTIRKKNKKIMQATEAGNDTDPSPIRLLTPKQAKSITRRPEGTHTQETKFRRHVVVLTWPSISFLHRKCFLKLLTNWSATKASWNTLRDPSPPAILTRNTRKITLERIVILTSVNRLESSFQGKA
jgi:hypothetical protein